MSEKRMTSAEKSDLIWKLEQANRNESELNDRLQAKVKQMYEERDALAARMRGVVAELRLKMRTVAENTSESWAFGEAADILESALSPPTTANDREAEVMDAPQEGVEQ